MFFQKVYTPGLSVNSYMIGDEETKQCVVIDPVRLVSQFQVIAENFDVSIVHILETHVHADFVSGSKELKASLGGKPLIHCSGLGGKKWTPSYADCIIKDGDEIKIGSIRLVALSTPGHTPEHIMWLCFDESRSKTTPWFVLSGDCVFSGSVGRPDLLGEAETNSLLDQLHHSLFSTLAPFPDFLELLPAHSAGSACGKALSGYSTSTLGFERRFSPAFATLPKKEWKNEILEGLGVSPPYFKTMKEINIQGPPLLNTLKVESMSEKNFQDITKGILIDVRHPEQYAPFHFPGSINIPFISSFTYWCGWFLPVKTPITLILPDDKNISRIVDQLRLIGFDEPISTYIWEEKNLIGMPYDSFEIMSVEELVGRQKENLENIFVLDVRTLSEWEKGHIPDSHPIVLNLLLEKMHEIPSDAMIATTCRSGYRGSTAASLLKRYGFTNVANIKGGVQAWKQAGFSVIS